MAVNNAFMSLHFCVSISSWFAAGKLGNAAWPASQSQGHATAELASQVNATSRHSLACMFNRPALSTTSLCITRAELCLAIFLASSTAGMCAAAPGSLLQRRVFMQAVFCVLPYLVECLRQI